MVDEVTRVDLTEGNTMIIPTGWIHAVVGGKIVPVLFSLIIFCVVYTTRCISIRRQFSPLIQRCTSYVCLFVSYLTWYSFIAELRVREIENATHVPKKFRFPLFTRFVSMSGNLVFSTLTLIGFAGTLVRSTCAISVPRRISPLVSWSQSRSFPIFWYLRCEQWNVPRNP